MTTWWISVGSARTRPSPENDVRNSIVAGIVDRRSFIASSATVATWSGAFFFSAFRLKVRICRTRSRARKAASLTWARSSESSGSPAAWLRASSV